MLDDVTPDDELPGSGLERGSEPRGGASSEPLRPKPTQSAATLSEADRGPAAELDPEPDGSGKPIGRRVFVGMVGVGLTSLVWGGSALNALSSLTNALPSSVRGAIPFGQGWRIYSVNPPYPTFTPASWQLQITGLVEKPMTLSYADFKALPQVQQTNDFHCVTGWSVDNVQWSGVRFQQLLAAAKPLPTATGLEFWSAETPYVDTLTMAQAYQPDALLAHSMDGKPLTTPHGAPARLVMPRMYGYKGVKWVQRINVVSSVQDGYWEQRGYDRDAWIGHSNGLG